MVSSTGDQESTGPNGVAAQSIDLNRARTSPGPSNTATDISVESTAVHLLRTPGRTPRSVSPAPSHRTTRPHSPDIAHPCRPGRPAGMTGAGQPDQALTASTVSAPCDWVRWPLPVEMAWSAPPSVSMAILRGLAFSATGITNRNTPSR